MAPRTSAAWARIRSSRASRSRVFSSNSPSCLASASRCRPWACTVLYVSEKLSESSCTVFPTRPSCSPRAGQPSSTICSTVRDTSPSCSPSVGMLRSTTASTVRERRPDLVAQGREALRDDRLERAREVAELVAQARHALGHDGLQAPREIADLAGERAEGGLLRAQGVEHRAVVLGLGQRLEAGQAADEPAHPDAGEAQPRRGADLRRLRVGRGPDDQARGRTLHRRDGARGALGFGIGRHHALPPRTGVG
jgi:hypothetical protein